jgi:hypothetical protein
VERQTQATPSGFLISGQVRPGSLQNVAKPFNFDAGAGGLAVSPDGRWILYTQFDQAGSELMLVENFR